MLVLIAAGAALQFTFFLENSFGLYFFLLWLFGLSLVGLTFLVSTLVKKASNATTIGFLIFVLGYFLQLGGSFIFSSPTASEGLKVIFALFSPTIFQVGIVELGEATAREGDKGFSWNDVNNINVNSNGWVTFQDMYLWLFLDFWIYFLLAIYLDNVLPSTNFNIINLQMNMGYPGHCITFLLLVIGPEKVGHEESGLNQSPLVMLN